MLRDFSEKSHSIVLYWKLDQLQSLTSS